MIEGKQLTVCFHVDDLKASHEDKEVLEAFVEWVEKKYGQERKVTVNRGKEHTYLGMILRYEEDGSVTVDMRDYVEDMLSEFPVNLTGRVTTPAITLDC